MFIPCRTRRHLQIQNWDYHDFYPQLWVTEEWIVSYDSNVAGNGN